MATTPKIALVTGGNKGIGRQICLELSRLGMKVYLGAREEKRGRQAAEELTKSGTPVEFIGLDVNREDSVKAAVASIVKKEGRIDVLINNAGILEDKNQGLEKVSADSILQVFNTNTLGPLRMMQTVLPLMKKQGFGRIVNMSSGMGQLSDMNGGYVSYRLSKTSLNALTRIAADENRSGDILINVMCPGWVRTDMGGSGATRPVEKGAETAIWLATLPAGGPTGKFFRDKKEIPW